MSVTSIVWTDQGVAPSWPGAATPVNGTITALGDDGLTVYTAFGQPPARWHDEGAVVDAWVTLTPYLYADLPYVVGDDGLTIYRLDGEGTSGSSRPAFDGTTPITDGTAIWAILQPWAATTLVLNPDLYQPLTPNGHTYTVAVSGYTAATEPTWPTAGGSVDEAPQSTGGSAPSLTGVGPITDGDVSWAPSDTWAANTNYGDGQTLQPTTPNGHVYTITSSTYTHSGPFSGLVEPLWPTAGGTITEAGDDGFTDPVILQSDWTWQVWLDPAIDRDAAPLGILTQARDRSIRDVKLNCGSGLITINRHDAEAAMLVAGNIVTVHPGLDASEQPVFGFILERTEEVALSPDEDGGDLIKWSGRGSMAILERAILYHVSYLPNGSDLGALPQDDRNGMWHWTDRPPAAILVRQLEEMMQRGTEFGAGDQDAACPNVEWTFTRHEDSNGDTWDDSAGALFKLAVGLNLFSGAIPQLMQVGLDLKATPYVNGDGHLRIRLDSYINPGVSTGIVFADGVNIVESGQKVVDAFSGYTDVLVQGDVQPTGSSAGTYVYRTRADTGFRSQIGRKEGFLPFSATPTHSLLDKAGDRLIATAKRVHNGPTTLVVLERTGEVPWTDYFPGDTVTVNIPGVWDNYEDNVDEIILNEDPETGRFVVGIQFASDNQIGVTGLSVDPCACSAEPPPPCN